MKCKECEICYEKFSAWPGLLAHRLEHLPKNIKIRCHLCDKKYQSSPYLEYHYLTVHNDGQKTPLMCKICQNRTYATPRKLKLHLRYAHSETKFVCDYCSKGFSSKSPLKTHIKSHIDHKPFVCSLCPFRCKLNSSLRAHKLRKHTPGMVACKACENLFMCQDKYDNHKCRARLVTCPQCGKLIKSRCMTRHIKGHSSVQKYKCERCSKSYKSKTALQVHMDRHDNVRRLECDYCEAKFFSQSVLIKHRRVHTGEKPYVCKICSKAFTGGSNLKVHMKVHGMCTIMKKDKEGENTSDIVKA